MNADDVFDAVLAVGLPILAFRALSATRLFQGVVLFISFGLLLALFWARLGAVDVALAEAALGAGFTGALLLNALVKLELDRAAPIRVHALTASVRVLAVAGLGGLALWAVGPHLGGPRPLAPLASEALPTTGVANPVTAVLLNFRGYDTLLEVGVVLLAAVAAASVLATGSRRSSVPRPAGPVLPALARVLVPLTLLVSVYVLAVGTSAPGGAFQASALLAGAAIILWAGGRPLEVFNRGVWLRAGLSAGLAVFLAVALGAMAAEGSLLQYPPAWAYGLSLLIEVCLTGSVALTLWVLFAGERLPP